jgi:hypothetical protein
MVSRRLAGRRPFDAATLELASRRRVQAGQVTVPHYDPDSPHFGGRDLHDLGKIETPWDHSRPHVEGSALVAAPLQAGIVPVEHYMRNMRSRWSFNAGAKRQRIGAVEASCSPARTV